MTIFTDFFPKIRYSSVAAAWGTLTMPKSLPRPAKNEDLMETSFLVKLYKQ